MTPWTLLFLAASVGTDAPVEATVHRVAPAGADCVRGMHPRAWRPTVAEPAGSAGMRIDLDPERVETAKQFEGSDRTHALRDRLLEELRPEVMADGSLRLDVGDLLQSYSVVRFDASGRPQFDCAHSADEAVRLSRRPVQVRTWEEK